MAGGMSTIADAVVGPTNAMPSRGFDAETVRNCIFTVRGNVG